MRFSLVIAVLITFTAQAASRASLPMGGEISFDSKAWKVQPLTLKEKRFLLIFHRELKDLQGQVMPGPIKDVGLCDKKSTSKLKTCLTKKVVNKNVSYVITTQRFAGKNAYLHHYITFSFSVSDQKKYSALIEKFHKNLGEGL